MHKRPLLKKTFIIIGIASLFYSCKNASSGQKPGNESSLAYAAPAPGAISQAEKERYAALLSRFFDSALLRRGFNGGILIAKEGNILYEQYTGYRDLRAKDSLTDTTAMHLASTSKPFTGMAILQLVQQGRLGLDDSLSKFFPELPYPGITIRMLLSHRSGLPNYVYFMADKTKWDPQQYITNEDMLQFMIREKPARSFAAGARFSYSNTNYVLLAMIIEKISGQSYPQYMQEHIFGPLQMEHTYVFTLKDTLTATPSFEPNGAYWKNDQMEGTYGDKNIYSTPRDMLKWDQALYSGRFIRPSLLDSAFMPQSHEHPSVHNYGLGWRLLMLPNGKRVVYHFGRWHGFTPAFARLTDEKVAIIILGNRFNRNIYNAAHKAYDLFGDYLQRKGGNSDDDNETQAEPAKKARPVKSSPARKPGKTAPAKSRRR